MDLFLFANLRMISGFKLIWRHESGIACDELKHEHSSAFQQSRVITLRLSQFVISVVEMKG